MTRTNDLDDYIRHPSPAPQSRLPQTQDPPFASLPLAPLASSNVVVVTNTANLYEPPTIHPDAPSPSAMSTLETELIYKTHGSPLAGSPGCLEGGTSRSDKNIRFYPNNDEKESELFSKAYGLGADVSTRSAGPFTFGASPGAGSTPRNSVAALREVDEVKGVAKEFLNPLVPPRDLTMAEDLAGRRVFQEPAKGSVDATRARASGGFLKELAAKPMFQWLLSVWRKLFHAHVHTSILPIASWELEMNHVKVASDPFVVSTKGNKTAGHEIPAEVAVAGEFGALEDSEGKEHVGQEPPNICVVRLIGRHRPPIELTLL